MADGLEYAAVQDYLIGLVPPRETEMQKMEEYARKTDFPIIDAAAGYACYQIARLIGAKSVFELGSGYGYSTAWFAKAVKENGGGVVHHVVWDEKLSNMAAEHLSQLGYRDLIQYHVAEAVATLRDTPGPFDLIFCDIEKQDYPAALPVIKKKLRPAGVLLTDNVLWSGRIFDQADRSEATEGVREFTRLLTHDPDWISTIIPVRDGVMMAYKK
ncbi:MAG TPA: O-methyltransferase [Anaerolineales bacterium]|nr:O-methyltransferase [Anaerolineales bacterium]